MTAVTDTCVVNVSPGETRIALLSGDRTVEVLHHRAGNESLVGNVYLGRVVRVVAGIQAAFVDIGAGRDGFLNGADARTDPDSPTQPIGALVHEGEAVLVQVQRDAAGDKGAPRRWCAGSTDPTPASSVCRPSRPRRCSPPPASGPS